MKVGKNAVVMGNVPFSAHIGNGSVVIGPTDSHGNTIINQPMAVGRGAHAGPGSIAIGAFAGAGVTNALQADIQQLAELVAQQSNKALEEEFENFRSELTNQTPNREVVFAAWEGVKALATIDGAHNLLAKITAGLIPYL
jgi:hypothetical protein